jgi:hypothetical protein
MARLRAEAASVHLPEIFFGFSNRIVAVCKISEIEAVVFIGTVRASFFVDFVVAVGLR